MSDTLETPLFSLHPDIVYTYIDDEAVLMGSKNEMLYGVNQVGAWILKQLASQAMSLSMIVESVLAHFEVDEAQSVKDTALFLESLKAQQFIVVSVA